jgi:4-hydroxybenzoate polyprenyltransferase
VALLALLASKAVNAAYNHKLYGMLRLKDITGLKPLAISASWAIPCVAPPTVEKPEMFLPVFILVTLMMGIEAKAGDIQDVNEDKAAGIETLLVKFGLQDRRHQGQAP